jgi:fructose-1-phosphate kinase PfkB-like protein
MILCITPNVAVDLTMSLDALAPAQIHRASDSLSVAGGKGVNVAPAHMRLRWPRRRAWRALGPC